jgi:hypothetical protein
MPLNCEGMPIEGIDRIKITLNPILNNKMEDQLRKHIGIHIHPKNHYKIEHSHYFGDWYFLTIQCQMIDLTKDIRMSIARGIHYLILNNILQIPHVSELFIVNHLDLFVHNIKEIEFYFDFTSGAVNVVNKDLFIDVNGTLYSADYVNRVNKPVRKSIMKYYNHAESLKARNHTNHDLIDANPYKWRIEYSLTKQNCPYRSIENLRGDYETLMHKRFIPLLAVYYRRFFGGNVIVDATGHPYFSAIYQKSQNTTMRYFDGSLKKDRRAKPFEIGIVELDSYRNALQTPFDTRIISENKEDERMYLNSFWASIYGAPCTKETWL